ncbi:unnamed protein product [Orchesella dallaii]|uniref:DNA-directed RNA polymerase I subunit D n=1 Tax=Orchesella dallaii TaxID=48710 RepID=A0ABP1RMQ2_9HEXA
MSTRRTDGYTPISPQESPEKRKDDKPPSILPPEVDSDEGILTSVSAIDGQSSDGVGTMKTFILKGETHTLGNLLTNQILRYPEVKFCGYSIPHPAEEEMHLRIQTKRGSGFDASVMLKKGLEGVISMCDHLEDEFNQQLTEMGYENCDPDADVTARA